MSKQAEYWIDLDYENLVTGECEGRALATQELTGMIHVITMDEHQRIVAELIEALECIAGLKVKDSDASETLQDAIHEASMALAKHRGKG